MWPTLPALLHYSLALVVVLLVQRANQKKRKAQLAAGPEDSAAQIESRFATAQLAQDPTVNTARDDRPIARASPIPYAPVALRSGARSIVHGPLTARCTSR